MIAHITMQINRIITAFDTFQASIGWFQFIRRRAHNWNLNQCPTSKLATFAEFNISLSLDVKFQYRKKVLVHWNAMTIFTWDETVCVKHLQLLFSHICIVSIQIIFTFLLMCGTVTVTGKFMIGLSKDNKNVINNSKKKTLNENCHWNGQHFERWEEKKHDSQYKERMPFTTQICMKLQAAFEWRLSFLFVAFHCVDWFFAHFFSVRCHLYSNTIFKMICFFLRSFFVRRKWIQKICQHPKKEKIAKENH